jgi:hypothetical protein
MLISWDYIVGYIGDGGAGRTERRARREIGMERRAVEMKRRCTGREVTAGDNGLGVIRTGHSET